MTMVITELICFFNEVANFYFENIRNLENMWAKKFK